MESVHIRENLEIKLDFDSTKTIYQEDRLIIL